MIKTTLIVGTGGFLGTALRYAVSVLCRQLFHTHFPIATFIVNIVGCLLIGLIFGFAEKTDWLTNAQTLFLATGFCGGFTTFSAFANESFILGAEGNWMLSAFYATCSIVTGVAAVWGGRAVVSTL